MTWHESKPYVAAKTPTPLHFPNSNSIVSCPGFSSWDFKTPCSLIFHHGNMLPQRKWGCSAQHHTHQLNLNSHRVQKEDQTRLTVEQWPHELWNDRPVVFPHLFVSLQASPVPDVLGQEESWQSRTAYREKSDLLTVWSNSVYLSKVSMVTTDHTNPVSLHCHAQTGWMMNEVILVWVCLCFQW